MNKLKEKMKQNDNIKNYLDYFYFCCIFFYRPINLCLYIDVDVIQQTSRIRLKYSPVKVHSIVFIFFFYDSIHDLIAKSRVTHRARVFSCAS